jgi:arsenite methyltransferase
MAQQFYNEDMARQQEKLAATPDMAGQRRALLEMLDLSAGQHVLDVGSGNGILVREMLEIVGPNGRVCGADSSEPMVEMATAICPSGEFLKANATDLPFEDQSFDAVTASQLLCFVAEVDKALAEMFRVLRPGGRLVILDSDWGSLVWNTRHPSLMNRTIELLTGPYADAHVPRTLSRRLIEAGFRIQERTAFAIVNWEPAPDTYAQQTVGFVESMMAASDAFTEKDWTTWIADQEATSRAGEYMFSLNRYLFRAERPLEGNV